MTKIIEDDDAAIIKEISKVAQVAYNKATGLEDFPDIITYMQARQHNNGDSLRDALVIEIHEGILDSEDEVEEVENAIKNIEIAIECLAAAKHGLVLLQMEKLAD